MKKPEKAYACKGCVEKFIRHEAAEHPTCWGALYYAGFRDAKMKTKDSKGAKNDLRQT